ncbi:Hypothetical protein SMAX5B_007415 [Scophthalmus maximus]|uniref:Uncharacterized protein n=1 Tax=Scophthalmus maximus TaxID=52904 RepID=A0A2U9BNY6_SCOMX|nr:Hypothetical protein SMAX5B_007415 [Scophthalmus maximus]
MALLPLLPTRNRSAGSAAAPGWTSEDSDDCAQGERDDVVRILFDWLAHTSTSFHTQNMNPAGVKSIVCLSSLLSPVTDSPPVDVVVPPGVTPQDELLT